MYGGFLGGGRPVESSPESITIEEIKIFAEITASRAWQGLGLVETAPPKEVRLEKVEGDFWGNCDVYYDGTITLNESKVGEWTVAQFAQVYLMEMGNWKNAPLIRKLNYSANKIKKDDYINAIELLEFKVIFELLKWIDEKDSPLRPSIWTARPQTFEEYMNVIPQSHKDNYGKMWKKYKRQFPPEE